MKPQDKMLLSLFEQYNKQLITFDTIYQALQPIDNIMIRFADGNTLWTLSEMYNTMYGKSTRENKQFLRDEIENAIERKQIELI
jgi:hypothetical protein